MTRRHQRGHLRCKRKNGPAVWEFRWRENDATGKRLRRTTVIGTVEQYPTCAVENPPPAMRMPDACHQRAHYPGPTQLCGHLHGAYIYR